MLGRRLIKESPSCYFTLLSYRSLYDGLGISSDSKPVDISLSPRHLNRGDKYIVLDGNIQTSLEQYRLNYQYMTGEMSKVSELLSRVEAGGGEKAIKRHVENNKKLLVKDRLKLLLDDGGSQFLELGKLAGMNMDYGDVPRAGLVTGIGQVSGRYCMILANDATVKGGTVYPITVQKQLRCQALAHRLHLPCIYLVDSGGAFLPLQADIFNQGGRVFYNEAVMSADKIPQLSVVCGSCTAGGAYVPTMSDQSIICHGIGTIFLGGPPLVYAATGERITPEQLGGAMLHSSVSGCTDYYSVSEEEAYDVCRSQISHLRSSSTSHSTPDGIQTQVPHHNEPPVYDTMELDYICPQSPSHNIDIYKVMSRICDGSKFCEFKSKYGVGIITGFCRIQGSLAGVIGNQFGSPIGRDEAVKASHFVQLANQQQIPLIFLVNSSDSSASSFHQSKELEGDIIKAHSQLLTCISCSSIDKITLVIGTIQGSAQHVMCGRDLEPTFHLCWPSAQVSATSALDLSHHLDTDSVISPNQTRTVLGKCLHIIDAQRLERMYKKQVWESSSHDREPLIRM